MKKIVLAMLFLCVVMMAFASSSDRKYTPLRLSGFNADPVMKPGEPFKESVDGQVWSFYSEDRNLRGGLPKRLRGLFSDVPYVFGDFSEKCALRLSAPEGEASGMAFESRRTVDLVEPVFAKTLWLLFTSGDDVAKVYVTVNYEDGTYDDMVPLEVPNWQSAGCQETAFWQLGRMNALGAMDGSYSFALYEKSISVSSLDKKISSITVEMGEKGESFALFAITASTEDAPEVMRQKKLFFLSDSHLDTQWNWTVKTTIDQYIKNTLEQTFERFEDPASKNFNFNFEGAIKYMWAKEYYPELYARLKGYVSDGKWSIAGGSVDANDVNIGSAESLIRNFLYGQTFYQDEFGVRGGRDIMLPDCFGFPWSLPTVAAHCGMRYFHTNKLSWNSAYAYSKLPRFARWTGTDGEEILAVLKTNPYDEHEKFRMDMSRNSEMANEIADNLSVFGIPATLKYVGPRGDRGGGLDKETADWLSKSVDSDGPLSVSMGNSTEMLDQVFHMGYDKLPVISHGLPMRAHGVGGYTSRCMLKFWMRKGELLGGSAEKASVVADWLGTLPYQKSTLTNAWTRLLWHQFHDDIPGTSINEAYKYTVNDQVLNQLDFSRTLNNAVGAVAQTMNTSWCQNVPIVVYNPLSINRTDIVEATVEMTGEVSNVVVTNSRGESVPSQILDNDGQTIKFIFLASVPSLGYATYNVAPSTSASVANPSLTVAETGLENERYKLTIDANGDVCSIVDKKQDNREMLSAPIRLAMLFDESVSWPSWEIHGDQLQKAPREYVDGEGLKVEIDENGPLRVSLKVTRTKAGSTFCQHIRLASAGAMDRIDFVNEVDWQTRERMLKATFPLMASNSEATYDLSIGADVNKNSMSYSTDTNNTDAICEFLGHRWADVTNRDGNYGVSILNDCKYGWDKQKDNELRLTLIHTPKVGGNYSYQGRQDLGLNKFTYSFFAHEGKWDADTQWEADKLNEPMLAYQTTAHDGPMGTDFAFANVNNPNVAVKAVKKAERSDKTIVRFYELTNSAQDVEVEFPAEIISAEEVNGVEELVGEASFSGRKLSFNIDRFHPKTFALTFASSSTVGGTMPAPASIGVDLDYNIDVVSGNDNRADADIAKAYPAELLADKLVADGITFNMGSRAYATDNAIRCEGQVVALPSNNGTAKLYMLASSLNESGSDAVFGIGGEDVNVRVEYNGGYVGVWSNSTDVQKHYRTENTAFTATHSHVTASGKDGVFDYLYMYKYVLPLPSGATELVLPNNPDILVYAVTLSDNRNDDTRPLSQIVQVLNHTDTEDTYKEVHHEDPIVEPVTVKASAYTNDSESPEKAADGDTGTKWCDNSSTVKWLEYKFDKPISISGWRVVNAGSESEDMIASEYYLQRYVDNGWVDVEGVHGNETNTTDLVLERPFVTTAVRLRIVSPERSTKGAARVYEFSVYGRDASAEDMARSQIISRRPTYGYGKQVARVVKSSGRVNVSEDARFILDSDRTTKWCYNGSVSKPYVIVELAGIYNVDRFDIYDSRTMEDYDNSDEYAISVSLDGKTFSTVASETGVSDESRHVCILPEPVAARYVKLQIGKGGSGAVRVYGFDIWGVFKENVEEGNDLPASIGKTILGSSDVKNFDETALNLVDGVSDVAELSWNFDNKGSGSPINWVVVDLEDSYSIDRLTLYDCKNQNNVENVTGYRVYTSTIAPTEEEMGRFNKVPGGTKWRRVASVTDDGGDIKTFSLDEPVVARYVKLEVPYKNVSDSAMLREFEIYGNLVSTNISGTLGDGLVDIYPCVVERGDDIHIVVSKDASYTLCSVGGEVVKTGIARGDTPVVTSSLPSGIYLVRVVTDKYAVCRKVVVR